MDHLQREELLEATDPPGLSQMDLRHPADGDALDQLILAEPRTFLHASNRSALPLQRVLTGLNAPNLTFTMTIKGIPLPPFSPMSPNLERIPSRKGQKIRDREALIRTPAVERPVKWQKL